MKNSFAALALTATVAACSGAASPVSPEAGDFPSEAFQTGMTASSTWQFEMRTLPEPPARGTNAAEFTFINPADGTPVDGLTLAVTPWMPVMGHGDGLYPTITPAGEGRYIVGNLDFYMPGQWQLQASISGPVTDAGTVTDTVGPTFDVP